MFFAVFGNLCSLPNTKVSLPATILREPSKHRFFDVSWVFVQQPCVLAMFCLESVREGVAEHLFLRNAMSLCYQQRSRLRSEGKNESFG